MTTAQLDYERKTETINAASLTRYETRKLRNSKAPETPRSFHRGSQKKKCVFVIVSCVENVQSQKSDESFHLARFV